MEGRFFTRAARAAASLYDLTGSMMDNLLIAPRPRDTSPTAPSWVLASFLPSFLPSLHPSTRPSVRPSVRSLRSPFSPFFFLVFLSCHNLREPRSRESDARGGRMGGREKRESERRYSCWLRGVYWKSEMTPGNHATYRSNMRILSFR